MWFCFILLLCSLVLALIEFSFLLMELILRAHPVLDRHFSSSQVHFQWHDKQGASGSRCSYFTFSECVIFGLDLHPSPSAHLSSVTLKPYTPSMTPRGACGLQFLCHLSFLSLYMAVGTGVILGKN